MSATCLGEDQWGLPTLKSFPTPGDVQATKNVLENKFDVRGGHGSFLAYHINMASYLHNLPPTLITALIKVESNFNPMAVSTRNARGYTQVKPEYWDGVAPYDIYAPEENIYAGAFVLDQYRLILGNLEAAAKAYNIGITNYIDGKLVISGNLYSEKLVRELVKISK
jgi:soluble lytic murein transglycosylase-like protein